MPHKGVVNNPNGRKRIWDSPEALWSDFEAFLAEQEPHPIKVLDRVAHVKPGHEYNDPPRDDDYIWNIEEVDSLSKQGVISIRQFAAWKKVHRTTIATGYSEGEYHDVYRRILVHCEAFAERQLYDSKGSARGIIFVLRNCYGWSDKPKQQTGNIDVPLSKEAQKVLNIALNRA